MQVVTDVVTVNVAPAALMLGGWGDVSSQSPTTTADQPSKTSRPARPKPDQPALHSQLAAKYLIAA